MRGGGFPAFLFYSLFSYILLVFFWFFFFWGGCELVRGRVLSVEERERVVRLCRDHSLRHVSLKTGFSVKTVQKYARLGGVV